MSRPQSPVQTLSTIVLRDDLVGSGALKGLDAHSHIEVEGLDAVDGTPVLDVKPVRSGYRPPCEFREPDRARDLMADYWD